MASITWKAVRDNGRLKILRVYADKVRLECYLPPEEEMVQEYMRQNGRVKEPPRFSSNYFQSLLGFYGVEDSDGLKRQERGRRNLGLYEAVRSNEEARGLLSEFWEPKRKNGDGYFRSQNQESGVSDFMAAEWVSSDPQRKNVGEKDWGRRVYRYACSEKNGGFEKWLEGNFPGLYDRVSIRVPTFHYRNGDPSTEKLTRELQSRIGKGEGVATCCVSSSLKTKVAAWFGSTDMFRLKPKASHTEKVAYCLGIPTSDINLGDGARQHLANLTERFGNLYLIWERVAKGKLPVEMQGDIQIGRSNCRLFVGGKDDEPLYSDTRIGDIPIDSKAQLGDKFTSTQLKDVVMKYGRSSSGRWHSGQPRLPGVILFHMPQGKYERHLPKLESEGIRWIGADQIQRGIEEICPVIEDRLRTVPIEMPRIRNLGRTFLGAYKHLVNGGCALTGRQRAGERVFLEHTLDILIKEGIKSLEHAEFF